MPSVCRTDRIVVSIFGLRVSKQHFQHDIMPKRRALEEISGNARKTTRRELSPVTCGYILGALDAGISPAEVAAAKSLNPDTVRLTNRKRNERPHQLSKPRVGGLKCYTPQDERHIIRYI
jgi:hypothetical protein